MSEKIYPKGIITFPKNEKQPDFVLGSMVITPNDLFAWLKENESLLTDYNGKKQMKFQVLNGDKGVYFVVDTFKPTPKAESKLAIEEDSSLPF
jgi:phage antirepressor YoqD-like protein